MLTITVPATEYYDELRGMFVSIKATKLTMEHSLVSLSKWESKWHKPFLSKDQKTEEEALDYYRCMTVTPNVDPTVYYAITQDQIREINRYLDNPMTATTFSKKEQEKFSREIITAEIIYYWMVSLQIPFECEKWHLNRLLTLVRVCNTKNSPEKKMSKRDIMAQNKALNAARRARSGSRG